MIGWTDYMLGFAQHAAIKSKDSTQVGCAIFGPEDEIRITGYNEHPRGIEDLPERRTRPEKYLWTSHAEENAVAMAAREGIRLKGCTAYVTHAPCSRCARSLITAGIVKVVIAPGVTNMDQHDFDVGQQMFLEAGVELFFIQPDEAQHAAVA